MYVLLCMMIKTNVGGKELEISTTGTLNYQLCGTSPPANYFVYH